MDTNYVDIDNENDIYNKDETTLKKSYSIRRKFTKSEDEQLKKLVAELGDYDWNTIASRMKSRSPRQCRERYKNYLAPSVVNGPWTPQEDLLLLQKYQENGPRWAKIVQFFKNRTDVNIKNHFASIYHKLVKSQQMRMAKTEIIQQINESVRNNQVPMPQINMPEVVSKVESPEAVNINDPINDIFLSGNCLNFDIVDPFDFFM